MNLSRASSKLFRNFYNNNNTEISNVCRLCKPSAFTLNDGKRYYCKKKYDQSFTETTKRNKVQDSNIPGGGLSKYKLFKDFDSPVILDIDEERHLRLEHPELFETEKERLDEFAGMNLERGTTGVFEIEELIEILRTDNAKNIVTMRVPSELQYVDYMVIVSGRSCKHLYAMAEFIRKLFKKKRHEYDRIPIIEGTTSKQGKYSDWLAMDLGNIVLHLFLQETREKYDLETLWSVGAEYDDLINQKEEQYISLLHEHTHESLENLIPLEESSPINEKKIA